MIISIRIYIELNDYELAILVINEEYYTNYITNFNSSCFITYVMST